MCGSDKQKLDDPPIKYLGHEIIGKDMDNGKFVVINPNITCGKCYSCLNGYENLCSKEKAIGTNVNSGFQGWLRVPSTNLEYIEKPDIKYIFTDPLAVVLHGMSMIKILSNYKVIVLGNGSIAKILVWRLNLLGIKPDVMCRSGIWNNKELTISNLYKLTEKVSPNYYDIAFECIGFKQSETIKKSLGMIRSKGEFICFGVFPEDYSPTLKVRRLFEKEITILGVRSFTKKDFKYAKNILDLHGSKLISRLCISVVSGENINAIMNDIENRNIDKVIVRMKR
ncbi:MAG: alcohol dehydrogenase catalytic domain-containing protein [Lactobacillus iners]|nr:alcohol dehydrogenase catalytic domain-containing protein [Lactobacillus iners]